MPRGSKPLEDLPPKTRDWTVPDEVWEIPRIVAKRGRQLSLDQKTLAKRAGVTQGTISKLLSYKTLKRFPLATAFALEDALDSPGLIVSRKLSFPNQRSFDRKAKQLSEPSDADPTERTGK